MKTCKRCKEIKPLDEFYKQRQISTKGKTCNYFDSYCKKCRCLYATERRQKIRKQAVEYLGGQCERCGLIDDPCAYDFHHRDPSQKDFEISRQSKSFESIKYELNKCALLCAICHRKEHLGM